MSEESLLNRIIQYLQAEYTKTGKYDPLEWRPLASKLGVTEVELCAALDLAIRVRDQIDIERSGPDYIRLGMRYRTTTSVSK